MSLATPVSPQAPLQERAVAGMHDVWVLGAGGMMAGEFLRLAAAHPQLDVRHAITRNGGEALSELHPHLAPLAAQTCIGLDAFASDVVARWTGDTSTWLVTALPHGEAASVWKGLRAKLGSTADKLNVIDLSADYRLSDLDDYARWYGGPHPDTTGLPEFVYGLPELPHAAAVLEGAKRIAAPGCFATALQLACVPPAAAGILATDTPWVLHAVTGSSGSGAKPKAQTHHPHRHGNFWAYAADGHRHEAELQQALRLVNVRPNVLFLPHSGPWSRGIHLSAVLPLAQPQTRDRVCSLFEESYGTHPFVHVLSEGLPDLRRVVGSNVAALGFHLRDNALVVELTLDNLIKGGSGQALQALNLALGLPETTGLPTVGMGTL